MIKKTPLQQLLHEVHVTVRRDEYDVLNELIKLNGLSIEERQLAKVIATKIVNHLRNDNKQELMEVFLAEYGLSTDEGVALMCLAEALLRVPDASTIDDLIEDKIAYSNWEEHLGKSSSSLVNAATWGLMFTGKILDKSKTNLIANSLKGVVKRLGEPVIRVAVKRAMKEMGHQFVLGETITAALKRGKKQVIQGYTYSFDMLGEAALTQNDATIYFDSYRHAIDTICTSSSAKDVRDNPGISIKLSALHPRYEATQHDRVMNELVPKVLELAQLAKKGNIGLNIDAEEADRLNLSLDVIQAVLEHPSLHNWDGFGVVVQGYNKSATFVLDWLYELAQQHNRCIMVRLVKGAYWDTEIKRAQVEGLTHFPVFTRKNATDISYLCCAKKLIAMSDHIYPQFATHNANTIAAILQIAPKGWKYEFQRLHGMGDGLFQLLLEQYSVRCRIYAPVGKHKDLLAYLVRRLLENGANSSFVNQIINTEIPVIKVTADPFDTPKSLENNHIIKPTNIFKPERINSQGWDLLDPLDLDCFFKARNPFKTTKWRAISLTAKPCKSTDSIQIINPSLTMDIVGDVVEASNADVKLALGSARPWDSQNANKRALILEAVATLYEKNTGEIFAILSREAGKTPFDAVAEIRESVDFLRYYAAQARNIKLTNPRGVFVCISPWNFPLAIFTGQICAALAAGNGVVAKPAETTPLIAFFATQLFYEAGVPKDVLQLLFGRGDSVGALLVAAQNVNGVCFTGSTATAQSINKSMAEHMTPYAPLLAETGGLNAMIVDSTALLEQAIKDVMRSAFHSAGQRCSALRVLYLQEDIYDDFLIMLGGAIDELRMGNAWDLSTDVGPIISKDAYQDIHAYIEQAASENRLIKQLDSFTPTTGYFIKPSVIAVQGIQCLKKEIFGPVLHVAKFFANKLEQVTQALNASGYGLTFGVHTRISGRVEQLVNSLNIGNIYVNRDQIGAIVGSQPFGGENLSGTGPKAGGPHYLLKFMAPNRFEAITLRKGKTIELQHVQDALDSFRLSRVKLSEKILPGPTGELNKLYEFARGVVLCLGPTLKSAKQQANIILNKGCLPLIVCPGATGKHALDGFLSREALTTLDGFNLAVLWSNEQDMTLARRALAQRSGPILPLVCDNNLESACVLERHVCIDTTAAGGNTSLLAIAT